MKTPFQYSMQCFIVVLLMNIFKSNGEFSDKSAGSDPNIEALEQNFEFSRLSRKIEEFSRRDYNFGSGFKAHEGQEFEIII